MPQSYYNQTQFNAGRLSPKLRKRSDLAQYQAGLKECSNFIPEVHGPLSKRPGTLYVNEVTADAVRLIPFIFSGVQAYVLEFTDLQMRVYLDGAIVGGGSPFTLTTTITEAMLPDIQYAQNGDIMYIVHPDLAPQELIRVADNDWKIHDLGFVPEPTYVAGGSFANDTTLAATSGSSVNWTADAGTPFRASDKNRFMVEVNGPGFAVVTSVTSTSVLVLDILTTFSTTDLDAGDWRILGSPTADIWISKTGPPGTIINVNLYEDIDDSSNSDLISNGDFSSGMTDWDDRSRPQVASGTVTSTGGDEDITDSGATFITDGVQENYLAINTTQNQEEFVSHVKSETELLLETGRAAWAGSDTYTINQTGSAAVDGNNKMVLNGQRNGIGWVEQDVTSLTADRVYALKFRIEDSPLSMQVGTTSKGSELLEERTYDIGEHEVYYMNTATTNYVQFRNNQYTNASLVEVQMKLVDITGFRGSTSVGDYIVTLGGVIEITAVDAADTRCTGIIRSELVAAEEEIEIEVVSGLWSLEAPAWTSSLGYPRTVALHDQRLVFGSTATFPARLWGSAIGDFTNFNRGESNDDDSWVMTPSSNEVNQFQWMLSEHNLMIGTGRDEMIIGAGLESSITASNRRVDTPSRWGSISHRPLRVGNAIIFIERNATSIREIITDQDAGVLENNDLTLLHSGIADAGIKVLAYQQRPRPTIWAVLNDGSVISGSYLKEQKVIGWVTHDFSDDVHDITVIPAGTVDQVWIAVGRISGEFQIEYMEEANTNGPYTQLVTDSTVIYNSTATDTITGLAHLNNREVAIVLSGEEHPNLTVSGSQVSGIVPDVTYAEVGLPITSSCTFLRPDNPQNPSTGFTINAIKIFISLFQSKGGAIDGMPFYSISDYQHFTGGTEGTFTGGLPAHGINSSHGDIPDVEITHSDPGPFTLQSCAWLIEGSTL